MLAAVSACSDTPEPLGAPQIPQAEVTAAAQTVYRIGPRDTLTVTVFREPELSVEEMPVDVSGNLSYPLIGEVQAAGLTAAELSRSIAERLNERYLRDARVSVAIVNAVNYTVTVDGEVTKPGVYPIQGTATLTQAVALGEGETDDAEIENVVILRTIDGQRYAARFDLGLIRIGALADPVLRQGDVVVVGLNGNSRLQRTILASLPGIAATLGVFLALR